MIFVDPREGSKALVEPLRKAGLNVDVAVLEYGDVAFVSRERRPIGIEFKTLGECIGALRSGRLVGHQLPGMLGPFGYYETAWLLIEGEWRVHEGVMQTPHWRKGKLTWEPLHGGIPSSEFHKRLNTLSVRHGLNVWMTRDRAMSVAWIVDQYHWWTDARVDEHDSGTALYQRPMGIGFSAISEFRRFVASIPGVGVKWSLAVEQRCEADPEWVMVSTVDEWAELEAGGRHLGTKVAQRIHRFLHPARYR